MDVQHCKIHAVGPEGRTRRRRWCLPLDQPKHVGKTKRLLDSQASKTCFGVFCTTLVRTFTLYNRSLYFTRFFPDLIQRKMVKKRNDKEPVNNLKQRKSDYFDKCFAAL